MPVIQFKGKTAIESYHRVVPHHVLDVDRKLSLSKNPGLDGNLIIEGDNLLALKSLMPTHAGRIKCIYIDPPYNTGNEGWVYNDNLTQPQFKEWIGKTVGKEGEDATRHDKWCCMMYPRLQLLRDLLSDQGVILVSIDNTELHHGRVLMDEVFGEENFVECIVWHKRISPANDAKWFSGDHEYVIIYAKSREDWRPGRLPRTADQKEYYRNPDNDPRGPWNSVSYAAGGKSRAERPNLYYPITNPNTGKKVWPKESAVWAYSPEMHREHVERDLLYWGTDGRARVPRWKKFLSTAGDIVPRSIWLPTDVGSTQEASIHFTEIFPDGGFNNPKPVRLLTRILQLSTNADTLILDSFAGSGTTAHAVLQVNKEDGGHRKFVLVQMPYDTKEQEGEKFNICEKITRERVKRVIEGYSHTDAKGKKVKVPGLGGEFSYARVGNPLFDEYRDLGKKPATYEQMARYIWFTETSRPFDAHQLDPQTGRIGEWQNTSYYLLYQPGHKEARSLDRDFLRSLKDKNPHKVVYCEKIWIHRDELKEFGDIRPMVVPFNLK